VEQDLQDLQDLVVLVQMVVKDKKVSRVILEEQDLQVRQDQLVVLGKKDKRVR
tara:strand:+ start:169 stop:327 length:159 start_codon:yes stop_codon:yes gene_type:complete